VIAWQRVHGRHELPWQNTRDPYRIWLSEIMLQQTQVAAVIGYYDRFLQRFPDVGTLAAAEEVEVMRLWSGLGYYSRARNLHRAARMIASQFAGAFPRQSQALTRLPGVGRSTAAAIAAFAFGERAAILDGNVKRVFARHFGIEGFPGTPAVEALMWVRAQAELPVGDVEAYTQGLMDLGATLCTRARPRCSACPLADSCVARGSGRTAELPHPRPRKARPQRSCIMLVLQDGEAVLLQIRPAPGIWGGLLSLPEAPDLEAARRIAERHGADWAARQSLLPIEHGFTHFQLRIEPLRLPIMNRARASVVAEPGLTWLPLGEADSAALPAPVKKLLTALAGKDLFSR
jgi:A/G-specific adenine glycosylase